MKRKLLIANLCLLFTSCHYLNTFSISNESGENLTVNVSFDENYLDKKNIYNSLMFNLENRKNIVVDTVNYKIKLTLEPKEKYGLGYNINGYPKLNHTKEITIHKKDSLVFYGNQYIIQNIYNNTKQNHSEVFKIY